MVGFGIIPDTLKPGKTRVLGDTLAGAPHIHVNDVELMTPSLYLISDGYKEDEFYSPLIKVLNDEVLKDPVKMKKFEKLATHFHHGGNRLIYEGKICVPRKSVNQILQMAHDCKDAGHISHDWIVSTGGTKLKT